MTEPLPLKAIFGVEIFCLYFEITVSSLCIEVYTISYKSANIIWLSAKKKNVLRNVFLEILIPFM